MSNYTTPTTKIYLFECLFEYLDFLWLFTLANSAIIGQFEPNYSATANQSRKLLFSNSFCFKVAHVLEIEDNYSLL